MAGSMNSRPPLNKAASFSGAEEGRQIFVPSAPPGLCPSNHALRSFLPRLEGHSLALTSGSPSPVSSHPPSPKPDTQSRSSPRPRNVLRRKPPTIGQYKKSGGARTEASTPEKLSVVIPNDSTLGQVTDPTPQPPCDHKGPVKQTSSQGVREGRIRPKMPNPPVHGPKELASLRTVNTQNLPPPTPSIPTASSPSTRYSGSPGIWSRTSTPTSLSSCSPVIVHSAKFGQRLRQPSSSQTRLPTFSPTAMSSPQRDRSDLEEPKLPNLAKQAESKSNPSLLKTEIEDSCQVMNTPRIPHSRDSRFRKFSTGSNEPKQQTKDSEAMQKKVDGAGRHVFEPQRQTTARTGHSISELAQAPSRPSREGTQQLELEPSPVIRSKLPPLSVASNKRRESAESLSTVERPRLAPGPAAARSVDSLQSSSSLRAPSRTTPSPVAARRSPQTLIKGERQRREAKSQDKPKRFGLFTKKSRTEMDSNQAKPNRKGPAAGTGHEGYGKYGHPSRRPSASSNGGGRYLPSGTKASSDTQVNRRRRPDLDLDDFLRDRLEPVVSSGGGMDGASLTRARSAGSVSGLSTASSNPVSSSMGYSSDSVASLSVTVGQPGPADSSTSLSALRRRSPARQGTGSDDERASRWPSILRGKPSQPANESAASCTSTSSHGSSVTALPQTTESFQSAIPVQSAVVPGQGREPGPRRKGSRWNFFQRSRGTEKDNLNADVDNSQLPVMISPGPATRRPVAHYAFVRTDPDPFDHILQQVEESSPTDDEDDTSVEVPAGLNIKKIHESVLLPSPPQMQGEFSTNRPSSPKVSLNKDGNCAPNNKTLDKRRSRLESIGRIPQVISRRDRVHRPAEKSFSRPFSVTDGPTVPAPVTDQHDRNDQNIADLNMTECPPPTKPARFGYDLTQPFGDPSQASFLDFLAGPYSNNEFLTFSRGMDAQHSPSSDSGGPSATTAAVPKYGRDPGTDEVWGEYDDLIDNFSPEALSSTSPRADSGEKFEMAAMASKTLQAELNSKAKAAPQIVEPAGTCDGTSSGSTDSVRLSRSRIVSALQSPSAPSSQPSYSDIIAAYSGDGENVDLGSTDRKLAPKQADGRQSSVLIPHSLGPAPSSGVSRQRNNALHDITEGDHEVDPSTVQTNLRSGSLMTSRWLSFGRVLFSPAHNHVISRDQQRILVIDGLGNDDWSFYCSLTYPDAEVYGLSMAPATAASTNPAAWKPPINHHTVHHANLERSFPFPKGFFAATVLRFPAACSEKTQDNVVAECKRVLRPGGYLEMGILDLDMVKMGVRTRKAMRKLKERTYLADPNISLKPASDNIQRILARHGLDNLRRCMVHVPVAGVIARLSGSSSSTLASNQSTRSTRPKPSTSSSTDQDNPSLGDLLSNPVPSDANDESIRKIVAKVARWWFSRCYEVHIQAHDSCPSIWTDKKLLRECQKTGTMFQLLIAYAQKPSERRRTASV